MFGTTDAMNTDLVHNEHTEIENVQIVIMMIRMSN